jgi:hypothetical protein
LEETYEGTTTVKSAKLYMFKDKISNFKIKDDESIPEMFYRLQVIINDLKSLGEKVKGKDFSHKFLMCLLKKFKTLRTIVFRGGLTGVSPNEVLGDVMTDAQYNDSDNEEVDKKDEIRRRKVWLSRHPPHPRARAKQRKKLQVKMKMQVTLMMKPCLF